MTKSLKLPPRYEIGDLLVDVGQRRVSRGRDEVAVGKLTFELLVALAESAPHLVTQRELAETVWANRVVSPETIAQRVKMLRRSLGDDAQDPRYIRVVRGQGYQLIPPVRRSLPPLADAIRYPRPSTAPRRRYIVRIAVVTGFAVLAALAIRIQTARLPKAAQAVSSVRSASSGGELESHGVTRFRIRGPAHIRQRLKSAPQAVLALSPDGRRIVFSARKLTMRSLDSLALRTIPGTEDAHQPFFSPDGNWVAYFTSAGQLKKVRVDASAPPVTLLGGISNGWADFGIWTDDDTIVYSTGNDSLSVVSSNGGAPKKIEFPGDSGQRVGGPMAVVTGTHDLLLTYGRGPKDTRIELYHWDTGQRVPILEDAWLAAFTASNHLLFVRDGLLMAAPFDVASRRVGPFVTVPDPIQSDIVGVIRQFAVSENGTLVYLAADGGKSQAGELVEIDRAGEFTPLTTLPPLGAPRTLDVSPDFRSVLITGVHNLEVVTLLFHIDQHAVRPLAVRTHSASWHGNGHDIILGGRPGLRIWDTDDATETILDASIEDAHSARFAPDGKSVVYMAPRPDKNIYAFDTQTGEERVVLGSAANEYLPAISPDGRWIAYVSDETGEPAVHIASFVDAKDGRPVTSGSSSSPVWSADGTRLFFAVSNPAARQMELRSVAVSKGKTLKLGVPRTVFSVPREGTGDGYRFSWGNTESAMFGVAPDNEHFLMMRLPVAAVDRAAEIIVVQNWLEELNQLVPRLQ